MTDSATSPARRVRASVLAATALALLTGPLAFAASGATSRAQEPTRHPWNRAVPFESAIVHYQARGSVGGTETLYLRAYGDERVRVVEGARPAPGKSKPPATSEITTTGYIARVDRNSGLVTRSPNPEQFLVERWRRLGDADRERVARVIAAEGPVVAPLKGPGIEVRPDTMLGYDCDVVSMPSGTTWFLHGTSIPLRMHSVLGTFVTDTVATSIEPGAKIDPGLFELPTDARVIDVPPILADARRHEADANIQVLLRKAGTVATPASPPATTMTPRADGTAGPATPRGESIPTPAESGLRPAPAAAGPSAPAAPRGELLRPEADPRAARDQ